MQCALMLLVAMAQAQWITVHIPNKEQVCVKYATWQERATVRFEVTEGGLLDIRFRLSDDQGRVIREKLAFFNKKTKEANQREGHVTWLVKEPGHVHTVCFDNTMSRWTNKTVHYTLENNIHADLVIDKGFEFLEKEVERAHTLLKALENIKKMDALSEELPETHQHTSWDVTNMIQNCHRVSDQFICEPIQNSTQSEMDRFKNIYSRILSNTKEYIDMIQASETKVKLTREVFEAEQYVCDLLKNFIELNYGKVAAPCMVLERGICQQHNMIENRSKNKKMVQNMLWLALMVFADLKNKELSTYQKWTEDAPWLACQSALGDHVSTDIEVLIESIKKKMKF